MKIVEIVRFAAICGGAGFCLLAACTAFAAAVLLPVLLVCR